MADPEFARTLEAAKRASVAQLLFRTARLMNEQTSGRVPVPPGAPRMRPSHTALFPHIDLDGTRPSEIARRLGISKQAVGQLVSDLEVMEAVVRVPDPTDGRARLVKFNDAPGRGLLDGLAVLRSFETELTDEIGVETMEGLKAGLIRLMAALERRAAEPDP